MQVKFCFTLRPQILYARQLVAIREVYSDIWLFNFVDNNIIIILAVS